MLELIGKWLTQVGTIGTVYTEVDFYVYIKAVEYLIAIGFFVIYNLFWKKIFKPDHWVEQNRRSFAWAIFLGAALACGTATAAPAPVPAGPSAPESVVIGSLSSLYMPVEFDHSMHVDQIEDCAACHHHTTGAPVAGSSCATCHPGKGQAKTVSCKECHQADPFTAAFLEEKEGARNLFHVDKPGLKGAYHLGCLGCHKEMGGPTGCRECHPLTLRGEEFYRLDARKGEKP